MHPAPLKGGQVLPGTLARTEWCNRYAEFITWRNVSRAVAGRRASGAARYNVVVCSHHTIRPSRPQILRWCARTRSSPTHPFQRGPDCVLPLRIPPHVHKLAELSFSVSFCFTFVRAPGCADEHASANTRLQHLCSLQVPSSAVTYTLPGSG